jgi:hypothetical protein
MNPDRLQRGIGPGVALRGVLAASLMFCLAACRNAPAQTAATDALPSWNDDAAKSAIIAFVGEGPQLGLIVHHDDAQRKWAYDRDSHIGRLDRALDAAEPAGWVVVSMQDDWSTIFTETSK